MGETCMCWGPGWKPSRSCSTPFWCPLHACCQGSKASQKGCTLKLLRGLPAVGKVNVLGQDYISLLVLDIFNVTISRTAIRQELAPLQDVEVSFLQRTFAECDIACCCILWTAEHLLMKQQSWADKDVQPMLHWCGRLHCESSMHSQLPCWPLMRSLKPRDQRTDNFQCPVAAGWVLAKLQAQQAPDLSHLRSQIQGRQVSLSPDSCPQHS